MLQKQKKKMVYFKKGVLYYTEYVNKFTVML